MTLIGKPRRLKQCPRRRCPYRPQLVVVSLLWPRKMMLMLFVVLENKKFIVSLLCVPIVVLFMTPVRLMYCLILLVQRRCRRRRTQVR